MSLPSSIPLSTRTFKRKAKQQLSFKKPNFQKQEHYIKCYPKGFMHELASIKCFSRMSKIIEENFHTAMKCVLHFITIFQNKPF